MCYCLSACDCSPTYGNSFVEPRPALLSRFRSKLQHFTYAFWVQSVAALCPVAVDWRSRPIYSSLAAYQLTVQRLECIELEFEGFDTFVTHLDDLLVIDPSTDISSHLLELYWLTVGIMTLAEKCLNLAALCAFNSTDLELRIRTDQLMGRIMANVDIMQARIRSNVGWHEWMFHHQHPPFCDMGGYAHLAAIGSMCNYEVAPQSAGPYHQLAFCLAGCSIEEAPRCCSRNYPSYLVLGQIKATNWRDWAREWAALHTVSDIEVTPNPP